MSRWPVVPLGEVLVEQKVRVGTLDADGLPLLGVSNVDGLHRSGRRRIGDMSKYLLVKDRWFAYNPMRVNVGSIGWAETPEQTGVISPDYVVFSCTDRVEPRLVHLFLTSNAGLRAIDAETAGSVRARLYFDALSRILVPLPPLPEQRRIVAKIESIDTSVERAAVLAEQVARETDALCRSVLADTGYGAVAMTPMRELVRLRAPDVVVDRGRSYDFAGVYCFGRGVFSGARRSGMEFSYERLTRLRTGDFVYPKLMAWEGAFGVVPPECDGLVVSTEFPVFEVKTERVLPEVLDVYFRSPSVWPLVSSISTGTNVRRRRLNPEKFLGFEMPLPSKAVQLRLRRIKGATGQIQRTRAEAARQLEAIPRAVVARLLGA